MFFKFYKVNWKGQVRRVASTQSRLPEPTEIPLFPKMQGHIVTSSKGAKPPLDASTAFKVAANLALAQGNELTRAEQLVMEQRQAGLQQRVRNSAHQRPPLVKTGNVISDSHNQLQQLRRWESS